MRRYQWIVLAAALAATPVSAQDGLRLFGKKRDCQPCVPCPPGTATPASPLDPNAPLTQPGEQPTTPFDRALTASAQESGGQPAMSRNPGMKGDFIGSVINVLATVQTSSGNVTQVIRSIDVSQAGGLKISESDSPVPQNRFYYLYNMYGAITVAPSDPSVPLLDVHRHVLGFEKTFLGGDASIGMRLPLFSFAGSPSYETGFVGDLSILLKFALINNRETGNVLTGGLVLTVPSGDAPHYLVGNARPESARNFPVTIQPLVGYLYNLSPRLYLHGFHSVAVPTDANEPTFMSNDVGVGFWLYRDMQASFIQGLIPTFEVHVNTPFDHRDTPVAIGQTQMLDSVNLTTGFYLVLPRSTFGAAVGVPLAFGPHTIEALASYTLRF